MSREGIEALKAKAAKIARKGATKKIRGEAPTVSLKKKPEKKRKNSREKGARYERAIAEKFMDWCGWPVKRTPQSGGWAKGDEFGVAGDLVCTKKLFKFHVEIKNRQHWALTDLITGVRNKGSRSLVEWWAQTTNECPPKKIPILVFTKNTFPDFIMIRQSDMDAVHNWTVLLPKFIMENDSGTVVILLLDDFLRHLPVPKKKKRKKK